MSRWKVRRGATLALVLCLFLAMGTVLLGALGMAASAASAAEREYRRSQALALAEAGIAEATAGAPPQGARPLGDGIYSWSSAPSGNGLRVTARGQVTSAAGAPVTRTVRALLTRSGDAWKVQAWEEGP